MGLIVVAGRALRAGNGVVCRLRRGTRSVDRGDPAHVARAALGGGHGARFRVREVGFGCLGEPRPGGGQLGGGPLDPVAQADHRRVLFAQRFTRLGELAGQVEIARLQRVDIRRHVAPGAERRVAGGDDRVDRVEPGAQRDDPRGGAGGGRARVDDVTAKLGEAAVRRHGGVLQPDEAERGGGIAGAARLLGAVL